MDEAVRRFADNAGLAIEHAKAAELRKEWEVALARWQNVIANFPHNPLGHRRAAAILHKELGRHDAAEAVLETAMAMFPNHVEFWSDHAQAAVDRKDRPLAIHRYQTIRERFPAFFGGYRWGVGLLRDEGRFDEAEAVLDDGLVRFPDNLELLVDRAWVATQRRDWDAALLRWEAVRTTYPDSVAGYWRPGQLLLNELARPDEAEELLAAGAARFPDHAELATDHARAAEKRGDWAEARQRMEALSARFPDNVAVTNAVGAIRNRIQLSALDAAHTPDAPATPRDALPEAGAPAVAAAGRSVEDRELVMRFESLGGNCEFGIVQRRCGAEPLGLLRWAGIHHRALLNSLQHRFEGVGEPEHTRVSVEPKSGEYQIHENRFGVVVHTFKMAHDKSTEQEKFYQQMCRRLQYLRRKMLEDLESGEKIFVYKSQLPLPDADVLAIRDAVLSYGPNTLLYVRTSEGDRPPGTVEPTSPGLLTGYIDRFVPPDGPWEQLSLPMWLTIAQKAHALWKPPDGATPAV
jgi:tetratricopeptide (TPR) repeat protein